jgi:hypothetical protein
VLAYSSVDAKQIVFRVEPAFLLAAVLLSSCCRNDMVRVVEAGEENALAAAQAIEHSHAGIKAERYDDVCQAIEDGALALLTDSQALLSIAPNRSVPFLLSR